MREKGRFSFEQKQKGSRLHLNSFLFGCHEDEGGAQQPAPRPNYTRFRQRNLSLVPLRQLTLSVRIVIEEFMQVSAEENDGPRD